MSWETRTRNIRNAICPLAWIWLSILSMWGQANEVAVQAFPATPLIEVRDGQQLLNFDFAVTNTGKNTLRLREIEMTVFNPSGEFVMRQTANSDGLSPGINIVSKPLLAPGPTVDVFNPFYSLADHVPSLLSCADIYSCEGLPAYFRHVERLFGSKRVRDNHATLDSGDVVEIEPQLSEQQNSDRKSTRRGMRSIIVWANHLGTWVGAMPRSVSQLLPGRSQTRPMGVQSDPGMYTGFALGKY